MVVTSFYYESKYHAFFKKPCRTALSHDEKELVIFLHEIEGNYFRHAPCGHLIEIPIFTKKWMSAKSHFKGNSLKLEILARCRNSVIR